MNQLMMTCSSESSERVPAAVWWPSGNLSPLALVLPSGAGLDRPQDEQDDTGAVRSASVQTLKSLTSKLRAAISEGSFRHHYVWLQELANMRALCDSMEKMYMYLQKDQQKACVRYYFLLP